MMKDKFEWLAGYNAWANKMVFAAASELSDEEYNRDLGAFFGSVHLTLNHILVGDQLWLQRIEGTGSAPESLDALLHEDLPSLGVARKMEDARIRRVMLGLTEDDCQKDLTYQSVAGDTFTMPMWQVLTHLFNHQTHHRGQAHAMLTMLGQPSLEMDFIYYLRLMQPAQAEQ